MFGEELDELGVEALAAAADKARVGHAEVAQDSVFPNLGQILRTGRCPAQGEHPDNDDSQESRQSRWRTRMLVHQYYS